MRTERWTEIIVNAAVGIAMTVASFWLIAITVGGIGAFLGFWDLCGD